MFVTNWISPTKIQKISEITNFFRHYFLSRTEVKSNLLMRKIRNFLCFFICSFHLNCPTTEEQITDTQVLLGEPKRFRITRNILVTAN